MADLSKQLPVEKMSDESWNLDKSARRARVNRRMATTIHEKSLFRQCEWVNRHTDQLGLGIIQHFRPGSGLKNLTILIEKFDKIGPKIGAVAFSHIFHPSQTKNVFFETKPTFLAICS